MLNYLKAAIILLITNSVFAGPQPQAIDHPVVHKKLKAIEQAYHIKAGVYAEDTNSGQVIKYHAQAKFPFQSTVKFIATSALLAQDYKTPLLQKTVLIRTHDLVSWHPISGHYLHQHVSLQTLAEGAVSYSDNTAINVIIHELGGLKAINRFAHSIGNASFTLNNYEAKLNSDPTIDADTSTPHDMGLSIKKIVLGNVLNTKNKTLLLHWMKNNTTGYQRIRSGVPLGWSVADKTGSGNYGIANDIGIAWSPACKPIVLSIFTISDIENATPNDRAVAEITRAIFAEFERHHACYRP